MDFRKSQVEQYEHGMKKMQTAMVDKDMKGSELENSIAENMREISLLKHRNKELNLVYEDTRVKLRKSE